MLIGRHLTQWPARQSIVIAETAMQLYGGFSNEPGGGVYLLRCGERRASGAGILFAGASVTFLQTTRHADP
jgi:hypothetical protein